MIECVYCGKENRDPHPNDYDNLITIRCWFCRRLTPTGRENEVRAVWEDFGRKAYPMTTAVRAMGLANAIYKNAESSGNAPMLTARTKKNRKTLDKLGIAQMHYYHVIKGRAHRGVRDTTTAAAIVVYSNPGAVPDYTVFVIFRGSVGDIMSVHEGKRVNVDWRANFDNEMEYTDYASDTIRVHGGFKSMLSSYREEVQHAMNDAIALFPGSNVIITGHSQGAAHAQLYAHWIAYRQPEIGALCIPFSPPRVGNFAFARDYTTRISDKVITLAYDGPHSRSYLMVKGDDPVVMQQRHAYVFRSAEYRNQVADGQELLKLMKYAGKENQFAIAGDVYFHPKNLTWMPGNASKLAKGGAIVDHHPTLFMNKILSAYRKSR